MHTTASASGGGAAPPSAPAASPASREASVTIKISEAAAPVLTAAASNTEVTDPFTTGTGAASSAAAAEAAAMPIAAAATPPPQAAAATTAAEQLQTGLSHHCLTAPAATPAAAPAASAAVSGFTCPSTAAAAGKASAAFGQDVVQQCLFGHQPMPTAAGMQENDSAGIPASCAAQTAAATAVGHSCDRSSLSQAYPVDSAQQRLGRNASIAQVLASLNRLPSYSNPGQQAGHAQLVSVSCSKLPQQSESTQQRSKSLQLQSSPQQAVAVQLSCGKLGELPQAVCATQPQSPVSRRHVTQQLSPGELSPLPWQVHAQSNELQGITQPLRPTQLRAATNGTLPSASECQLFGVSDVHVSLPKMEMGMSTGPVLGAGMVQSTNGTAPIPWLLLMHCVSPLLSPIPSPAPPPPQTEPLLPPAPILGSPWMCQCHSDHLSMLPLLRHSREK